MAPSHCGTGFFRCRIQLTLSLKYGKITSKLYLTPKQNMEDFGFLIDLIKTYGYIVIGVGIFLECMGVPFPGETVLILGGVAASMGHLSLPAVMIIAATAAVLGDNMGFFIGRKFGRKIIKKFEHFPLFHYKHVDRAERFFKIHGNKTVFIGRFTAILRTYSALFAGVFDMNYATFFFYNLSGGVLWAVIFGFVGFYIGNNLDLLGKIISDLNLVFFGIVGAFVAYQIGKRYLVRRQLARDKVLQEAHKAPEHVHSNIHRTHVKIQIPTHKTAAPIMSPLVSQQVHQQELPAQD